VQRRPFTAFLAVPLAALAVVSCGSGNAGSGSSPSVEVVNAAFDAPVNYDVLLNGASVVTDLSYDHATAFTSIATGTTTVKFEATGTTTVDLTASFAADNGFNYSVMAIQGSSGVTTLTVGQNNAAVASNQARLGFVNAAPSSGALDFFVTTPSTTLPLSPALPALSFPGDGASIESTTLVQASGDFQIRAIASGDTTETIIFDSGPISFASAANLLFAAIPVTGSASSFALLTLGSDGSISRVRDQRVQVRAGNFSPSSLVAVDTYLDAGSTTNIDNTPISTSLAQGAVSSAYKVVYPGAYRASFTQTGLSTELVGADLTLASSSAYSLFMVGVSGQASPYGLQVLQVPDDLQAAASGLAKLRVVDLSPDISNPGVGGVTTANVDVVQVTVQSGVTVPTGTLVPDLAYLGVSSYVLLTPGTYNLALVPTGVQSPVLPVGTAGISVSLAAGSVQTVIIYGCQSPGSGVCASSSTPLTVGVF
jgi:hypothetical protein